MVKRLLPFSFARGGIAAFALIIAALALYTTIQAPKGIRELRRVAADAQSLQGHIDSLQNASSQDLGDLHRRVEEVAADFRSARRGLTPFLQISTGFRWAPVVGPRLRSASDMLTLGNALSESATLLLQAATNVMASDQRDAAPLLNDSHFDEQSLLRLAAQEPLFHAALARLAKAEEVLDRISGNSLPSSYQTLALAGRQLAPEMRVFARTGIAAAQSWQRFLGYQGPRTYLIVAQNSDELRATGGFIPGAWLLTLDRGEISVLQFWDTTAVDDLNAHPPLPPEGLLQTLWAGAWLFRDATWYPDFPTTANVIEQMFKLGVGTEVDGVIGLNQGAVQRILQALGSVPLPDGQLLEPSSFMMIFEKETDAKGREYLDAFLQAVLERLRSSGSRGDLVPLLAALNGGLRAKEILLFFHDPALQETVHQNGWDGSLSNAPGDYLMVVDSNVGFSKVNRNITREIRYDVNLGGDSPEARLDITYHNLSSGKPPDGCRIQSSDVAGSTYAESKNACYWDYVRVYTPDGGALGGSSPFPMPQGSLYRRVGYNDIEDTLRVYQEAAKTVFAGFFTVEIGATRAVAFIYTLPQGVLQKEGDNLRYNLRIQKQPGIPTTPSTVTVRLPSGYRLLQASPTPVIHSSDTISFSTTLESDQDVQIVFTPVR